MVLFLTVFYSLVNLNCTEQNGYYSIINDSNIETVLIGKNNICELNVSVNQIGDKINLILYPHNIGSLKGKLLLIKELDGNINAVEIKNAKKIVYLGSDKMEFTSFSELLNNKQLFDNSGYNVQYYFQFNKTDFKEIKILNINLECTLQLNSQEIIFSKNFKMKRHIRVIIHP